LRALRANRYFCADEKRIRAEITVMDKSKGGSGWFLYKIVDRARTVSRPRNIETLHQRGRNLSRHV